MVERIARRTGRPQVILIQLAVAFGAFVFIGTQDGAVGVLLPSLQAHYALTKGTVSVMFFASTIGYLLAALSTGLLVDRLRWRAFLTLGGIAAVSGAGTIATVPAWAIVLLALVSTGFGIGVIDAGLNAYIASLPDNAAPLNYLHACYGMGALLGPLLASSILAGGWAWNRVYVVLASAALVFVAGFALIFRAPRPVEPPRESRAREPLLSAVIALPIVWLGACFLLLYVGLEVSLGSWMFSLLTEDRGAPTLLAGSFVSAYWAGLMLGRLLLGSVTRRLGNVAMIQLCLAGVVVGVLLLWLVPLAWIDAAALVLIGFSLGPIFPTTIAFMSQLVPARLLPSAIGLMASLGAAGASLFPWLAGMLADRAGIWIILPFALGLTALLLLLWMLFQLAAARRRPLALGEDAP
jgi:fucose permease